MRKFQAKKALAVVGALTVVALASAQIMQVIKVIGVGAAVKQFGPQINSAINKLTGFKETATLTTKVVPILTIGVGQSSAIGAAQVTGPKNRVDTVEAVASPELKFLGEVRIRAFIPVSSKDVIKDIRKVDGVSVTGIVDLKL